MQKREMPIIRLLGLINITTYLDTVNQTKTHTKSVIIKVTIFSRAGRGNCRLSSDLKIS